MSRVLVIAKNTVLESLRNKIIYTIVLFALLITLGVESFSHFQKETQIKLVKDLAFGAISLFTVFIGLFVTMEQVPNEIERRTIYFILTRPVFRLEFLLGKFVGVNIILMLTVTAMGGILLAALGFSRQYLDVTLLLALILLWAKASILSAVVICLSTFSSNIVSVMVAILVYSFGHVSAALAHGLGQSGRERLSQLVEWLQYVLPNFQLFDLTDVSVADARVSLYSVVVLLLYAFLFCLNFLLVAHAVFHRKDL